MIQTDFNGNFGLDKIKRITKRMSGLNSYYEIRFMNDIRKLYCCRLHSFLTDEGIAKTVNDLKIGDKIWIDISAFSKDSSFK